MSIPQLNEKSFLEKLKLNKNPHASSYLAMYSSWLGGIVTQPHLMLLPIDDHVVHRGDGVFEAFKVIDGRVYLLNEHLDRLYWSSSKIHLKCPLSRTELTQIIALTIEAAQVKDCMVRLYLTRGPGGFSVNPYDSVGSQLYVVVTTYSPFSTDKMNSGVRVGRSQIPVKPSWLAQVKTCNYIPNVLMKQEAVDRGLDFVVGFDSNNYLTESATENMIIIDEKNNLMRPKLDFILKGTTMIRILSLAEQLVDKENGINGIGESSITEDQIFKAKEVMMVGTTLDIISVAEYNGIRIGTSRPGPIWKLLYELLIEDIKKGPSSLDVKLDLLK